MLAPHRTSRPARLRRLGVRPCPFPTTALQVAPAPVHPATTGLVKVDRRGRNSTCCTCCTGPTPLSPSVPMLMARRRPIGRDVSHLDHESLALSFSGHSATLEREDRRPHRGVHSRRRWQMERWRSDACRFPTGWTSTVRLGAPARYPRAGKTVLFSAGSTKPQGMAVLSVALPLWCNAFPISRSLSWAAAAGRPLREEAGDRPAPAGSSGRSTTPKASALAPTVTAPQRQRRELASSSRGDGGRHPVVASNLDAFGGCSTTAKAGCLVPVEDSDALGDAVIAVPR